MKVAIIESVSSKDVQAKRYEGPALEGHLKKAGIATSYEYVRNTDQLSQAIASAADADVVHVSCHANDKGIVLEDQTFIRWEDLKEVVGDGLKDKKLSLSSCEGGVRSSPGRLLFQGGRASRLVGPFKAVGWDESLAAFKVYYDGILKKRPLADIASDMNKAAKAHFRIYERTDCSTYVMFPTGQNSHRVRRKP